MKKIASYLLLLITLCGHASAAEPFDLTYTCLREYTSPSTRYVITFSPEKIDVVGEFSPMPIGFDIGPVNVISNIYPDCETAISTTYGDYYLNYYFDLAENSYPGVFELGVVKKYDGRIKADIDAKQDHAVILDEIVEESDLSAGSVLRHVGSGDFEPMHVSEYGVTMLSIEDAEELSGEIDYGYIINKPSTFSPSSHSHAQSDITGLVAALAAKQGTITAGAHINNADVDAATDAATNAATNAITNASASSVAILGISVPTNASYSALVDAYNDLATKYNEAAGKYNAAAAKYNAAAAKYNDAATKFNALVDSLEAQGIQTP